MNDYEKLKATLKEIGADYCDAGEASDWRRNFYSIPKEIEVKFMIACGDFFCFDGNGRFVGMAIGDEQSFFEKRVK